MNIYRVNIKATFGYLVLNKMWLVVLQTLCLKLFLHQIPMGLVSNGFLVLVSNGFQIQAQLLRFLLIASFGGVFRKGKWIICVLKQVFALKYQREDLPLNAITKSH